MTADETRVLRCARLILERYMTEDEGMLRDDVAEVCIKIDDLLPPEPVMADAAEPCEAAAA